MKRGVLRGVHSRMDVLLLDSRDSFSWILAHGFAELGASVAVVEADAVNADALLSAAPKLVCLGPGPRGPRELPHLVALAAACRGVLPLFGVCLGLQAIVRAQGGEVNRAQAPVHGKRSAIRHDGRGVFQDLPSPLWVMRYHSLVATRVPAHMEITAQDAHGQIMGVRNAAERMEAVQFHPESIGTAGGSAMLARALQNAQVSIAPALAHGVTRAGSMPSVRQAGPSFTA